MAESFEILDFEKGDALTSPQFRQKLNLLVKAVRDATVVNGVGYTVSRFGNGSGTTLEISSGNRSSSTSHPFRVFYKSEGVVRVTSGSLLKSFKPDDRQAITGLESDLAVDETDCVWLELTILNANLTAAEIKTNGSGGNFDPTLSAWEAGAFVEDDGATYYSQTIARILIAYINPTAGLVQCLRSDLIVNNACITNGTKQMFALYAIPYSAPYIEE